MNPWTTPETVAGFAQSPPNASLMRFAAEQRARGGVRALDIGCGAARNAVPLALQGWQVVGTDTSWPMLAAAARRAEEAGIANRLQLAQSPMTALPVFDRSADLIVAHGIWNLARSGVEFHTAVREAARAARNGAALFLFTFSRSTLPANAAPVSGETFVFTQFSGQPQCFLTSEQLLEELSVAGFHPDQRLPLHELNRPTDRVLHRPAGPVIYEGAFRFSSPGS
jgi:SAM-dependent methyltransferase